MSNEMKLLSILAQTGLHKYEVDGEERQRNIPAMLVGYPGIGKTQIVQRLGKELALKLERHFPVEVFTAPQRMPEEVGGIPVPYHDREEVLCLPMRIGKKLLEAGCGIFFADEWSSANQAMGGALMTAVQDGRFGDLVLSHAVARIGAMNPPECAAAGRSLTAPESNRFCWINWNLELNDWVNYMRGGTGTVASGVILPARWEYDFGMEAKGLVISYLQRHNEHFKVEQTMPKAHDSNKPWESPRSWENAARLLAACKSVGEGPDSDLAFMAMRGCLGDGGAEAFLGWFKEMDLPDPEELLADPKAALDKLPVGRPDKLQVALESVANAACLENEKLQKRWEAAWKIIGPTLKKQPDNALYAAKILSGHVTHPKLKDAKTPPEAMLVKDLLVKIGARS